MVAKTLTHTYVESPGLGGGLDGRLGLSPICSGTPRLQHRGAVLPSHLLPALVFCEVGAEQPHLATISTCHRGLKIAARR